MATLPLRAINTGPSYPARDLMGIMAVFKIWITNMVGVAQPWRRK